jgi:hypothetical protein
MAHPQMKKAAERNDTGGTIYFGIGYLRTFAKSDPATSAAAASASLVEWL